MLLLPLMIVGGGATAAPVAPMVVTSGGLCICHAPIYVGIAKGIFEKHGLNLRVLRVASGFEGLTAVQTGSAHVADAVMAVVAQAAAQGVQVKAVLMANGDATGKVPTDNYFAIIARRGSGVREGRLEDLKGKKIGLPRGTIAHQYFFYAAQAKGLDPTRDVTIQHVTPADLPSALQSGSVDAIVAWEPIPLQALSMISDAVTVYRGGNHIQYLFQRWMSPRYVATNPGTVKKFVVAFAEAAQYARMNPDETTDILMRDFRGLSRDTVRRSLGFLTFDMRVSKATLEAVKQGFEFAVRVGALKQAPSFEEMTDLRFLTQVLKEYPQFFRDLPPIPENLRL
ncbi:MAG: ABC transporter substrate-binding protein [Armatimonadetes bacterium]|nr:ABC transporter substrate-binding protein [Armatimonadota bacterium]